MRGDDAWARTCTLKRMDKLQRAGRDFLMRLVAKHGPAGAARILRALADELASLAGYPRGADRFSSTAAQPDARQECAKAGPRYHTFRHAAHHQWQRRLYSDLCLQHAADRVQRDRRVDAGNERLTGSHRIALGSLFQLPDLREKERVDLRKQPRNRRHVGRRRLEPFEFGFGGCKPGGESG